MTDLTTLDPGHREIDHSGEEAGDTSSPTRIEFSNNR